MTKRCCKGFFLLLLSGCGLLAYLPAAASQVNQTAQAATINDQIIAKRQLELPFSYINSATISEELLFGYSGKTLTLRLKQPQTVLSSLHGWREEVLAVGNHYSAPASWPTAHTLGLEAVNQKLATLLKLNPQTSLFLFTGANMDNLVYIEKIAGFPEQTSWDKQNYGGKQTSWDKQTALSAKNAALPLKIGVLATAGVQTNALRAGRDRGTYWEPGTINLIILTNRTLSPAAMSGALISATEAKTAALEDLDIRSSTSGLPATGTGTDNIIVLAGAGEAASMSGGHTILGEMLTKAVYEAVTQAIAKQNQLLPQRGINQRLAERGINLQQLLEQSSFGRATLALNAQQQKALLTAFQKTLAQPRYAGFMASALALADSQARGLLPDTSLFSEQCLLVASQLAGQPLTEIKPLISNPSLPPVLQEALNAMLTGILAQNTTP